MRFITKQGSIEIWAQFDESAEVYELFFDKEGETYRHLDVIRYKCLNEDRTSRPLFADIVL